MATEPTLPRSMPTTADVSHTTIVLPLRCFCQTSTSTSSVRSPTANRYTLIRWIPNIEFPLSGK